MQYTQLTQYRGTNDDLATDALYKGGAQLHGALLDVGVALWYARVGDYLPALLLAGVAATHSPDLVRALRDHRGAR